MPKKRFVELFAGSARMSENMSRLGVAASSYEITRHPLEDVTSNLNSGSLWRDIASGKVAAVWAGITCASWSMARRGPADYSGPPPPLRSSDDAGIWGLPNLRPRDQERVRLGNRLVRWLCRLTQHCIQLKVPILVENPQTSRLWLCPPMRSLLDKHGRSEVFHACQFGEAFKKPTKVAMWNCNMSDFARTCKMSNGMCSNIGAPHWQLSGVDESGQWRSAQAATYSHGLCRCVAKELVTMLSAPQESHPPRPVHH